MPNSQTCFTIYAVRKNLCCKKKFQMFLYLLQSLQCKTGFCYYFFFLANFPMCFFFPMCPPIWDTKVRYTFMDVLLAMTCYWQHFVSISGFQEWLFSWECGQSTLLFWGRSPGWRRWVVRRGKNYCNIWSLKTINETHWSWDKMAEISQVTFSNAFSWMKMCEFRLIFHWSLFLTVKLTISQHWFR